MARFQESIDVQAPIGACFDQWMRFEEFPLFMEHVQRISRIGDNQWHWIVDGPMGAVVEWDATMDGNVEDQVISWHSTTQAQVDNQGAVRFEPLGADSTRITCTIQYEPPAGGLGEAVAKMFSNPEQMVKDALQNFKDLMENRTSSGVHASSARTADDPDIRTQY